MTRVEYIRQLEFSLNGKLSKKEISDILRDYTEYFEAGKAEGKSEEEIVRALGIPSVVAAQILSENEEEHAAEKKKSIPVRLGERVREWGDRASAWCKKAWACIMAFFRGLLSPENRMILKNGQADEEPPRVDLGGEPGAEAPPPPPPPGHTGRVKRAPSPRRPFWQWLAGLLCGILLLPLAVMCLIGGGIILLGTAAALAMLAIGLLFAFLFGLFLAFCGAMGVSFFAGILPGSAVAVGILLTVASVAGGVFALCLGILLFRGIAWLVRFCLGRSREAWRRRPWQDRDWNVQDETQGGTL